MLASVVMDHAGQHRRDPRLPAALEMLIRAHDGCAEGPLTGAMFRHLHRHFPGSVEARRAPSHR